jgi:hypothetical protein
MVQVPWISAGEQGLRLRPDVNTIGPSHELIGGGKSHV